MPWTRERWIVKETSLSIQVITLCSCLKWESREARGYTFNHIKWHLFVHKTSSIRLISPDDPIRWGDSANALGFLQIRDVCSDACQGWEGPKAVRWAWSGSCSESRTLAAQVQLDRLPGTLVAQTVNNLPADWETWVRYPSQEDPLEKGMATHSSFLAWRIPWTEEPGGCCPWSCRESDTTEWLTLSLFTEGGKQPVLPCPHLTGSCHCSSLKMIESRMLHWSG